MKKLNFWILIFLLLLLQLADGFLTYINTPDLSMEGNPLVAKLGLGWGALFIANVIAFVFIFIISYYSYFKYKTKYTTETKFTTYCSQIIYDRPDKFWIGIIPKHFAPFWASLGYAELYALIFGRAVLVFEWLYITFNEEWWTKSYFLFEEKYCFGRLDILVVIIITVICMVYWFYKEFKEQLPKPEAE